MSEFKGTPGPWNVSDGPIYKMESIFGPNDECIAEMGHDGERRLGNAQHQADANLIAAAPDLLEALELCVDIILDQSTDGIGHDYALQGLAAIKKALQS